MGVINVDSYYIKEAGNDIVSLTREIRAILDDTFNMIENMPTQTGEWLGEAAESFVWQTRTERKDYNQLVSDINAFGKFLINYSNEVERLSRMVKK